MAASGYFAKVHSNRSSVYAIATTVIIHFIAMLFFIYGNRSAYVFTEPPPLLQMIELKADISDVTTKLQAPSIDFQPKAIHLNLPTLDIIQAEHADLTHTFSASDLSYELPDKNSELYKDVFDPKLRKKLQEAHANRRPVKKDAINTWQTSGGTTLVDMGDGECIASMSNADSHARGTNWSMLRVKCGKTDSEKMMDNVTADLEARKHPLDKK